MPATPLDVKLATRSVPAVVGIFESATVRLVAVALDTVPIAPLSKVTTLFAATVPKPKPVMVTDAASIAMLVVVLVITGVTLATFTDPTLLVDMLVTGLLTETMAVRLPDVVGLVVMLTVNDVLLAAVTTAAAPLLNVTELLAAVGSKPKPLMVRVVAFAASDGVLAVTIGLTLATCTAEPLFTPLVVTTAVRAPASGFTSVNGASKLTVSRVAVAAVILPIAPELKATVLSLAVVLKPLPIMKSSSAFAAILFPAFAETTGVTEAICENAPKLPAPILTLALSGPATVGLVESVTASDVADKPLALTVPTAPLVNSTTLFAAVTPLKPKPAMVTELAFTGSRSAALAVTVGTIVAT